MDIRSAIRIVESAFKITHDMLSSVIRITVKTWILDGEALSAEDISSGHCGDFADNVWRVLGCPPDSVVYFSSCYTSSSGHAWLTFEGKHYDAECPEGVSDWRMLPFWQRDARSSNSIMYDDQADLDIPE